MRGDQQPWEDEKKKPSRLVKNGEMVCIKRSRIWNGDRQNWKRFKLERANCKLRNRGTRATIAEENEKIAAKPRAAGKDLKSSTIGGKNSNSPKPPSSVSKS